MPALSSSLPTIQNEIIEFYYKGDGFAADAQQKPAQVKKRPLLLSPSTTTPKFAPETAQVFSESESDSESPVKSPSPTLKPPRNQSLILYLPRFNEDTARRAAARSTAAPRAIRNRPPTLSQNQFLLLRSFVTTEIQETLARHRDAVRRADSRTWILGTFTNFDCLLCLRVMCLREKNFRNTCWGRSTRALFTCSVPKTCYNCLLRRFPTLSEWLDHQRSREHLDNTGRR